MRLVYGVAFVEGRLMEVNCNWLVAIGRLVDCLMRGFTIRNAKNTKFNFQRRVSRVFTNYALTSLQ